MLVSSTLPIRGRSLFAAGQPSRGHPPGQTLGRHPLLEEAPGEPLEHWTFHDLRRTAATGLEKLHFPLPVTEAVLNHISGSKGGIVGIYQRYEYTDEKREALDKWAGYIEKLINNKVTGRVARLRSRRQNLHRTADGNPEL
jgi:hypothetical protein